MKVKPSLLDNGSIIENGLILTYYTTFPVEICTLSPLKDFSEPMKNNNKINF